jgi:ankyrin repeat protein
MPSDNHFRKLPLSPDFTHLRNEAKNLKEEFNSGDATAMEFARFHTRTTDSTIKLAVAQFALARSYGFKSWARLKAYVDLHALSLEARVDLLLRALFESNYALLLELYSQRDRLSPVNVFTAAALGDFSRVETLLRENPELARLEGGPKKTQALTYAAHAPFAVWDLTFPDRQQQIVKLLLANGADPNASAQEEGKDRNSMPRASALYGCCRQPGNPALARILLDAGATTHDGESLYHASELKDTRCLELLFQAGVDKEGQEYCIRRVLDDENPTALEIYLKYGTSPNHLDWALFRERSFEILRLLVEHGADLKGSSPADHWLMERVKGLTPIQIAERNSNTRAVEFFLEKGATDNRTASDLLIGACARADREAAKRVIQDNPNVVQSLATRDHSYLSVFARSGRLNSVDLMLDIGFDIEARADDLNATGLLYAASNGDLSMAQLLIRRGARLDVTHKYNGNPLGTAIYCAAYFRDPSGDYAGCVRCFIEAGIEIESSSLEFAIEHELDDIAEVLKSHGATV